MPSTQQLTRITEETIKRRKADRHGAFAGPSKTSRIPNPIPRNRRSKWIKMKSKRKLTASFPCFSASVSDGEEKDEQRESLAGVSPENHRHPWRQRSRRILSKIARSLSSGSNSSNRKSGRLSADRSSNGSDESENRLEAESFGRILDNDNRRVDAIFSSSSSASSSSSTSSLLSSVSSSSCPAPEPKLRRKKTLKTALESRILRPPAINYGYAIWLCLLLLSLFIMVFCGRLCAILWTSSWFCLIPRRKIAATSPEFDAVAVAEVRRKGGCREADKKRVVLEGLLQRR